MPKVRCGDAEVANQAGEYKNFAGLIDWKGTQAYVQDANFELLDNGDIWWRNGTWRTGIWEQGIWYDGVWLNGTWKKGTWLNGTWGGGVWEGGTWKRGAWKNGKINGEPSKVSPARFNG